MDEGIYPLVRSTVEFLADSTMAEFRLQRFILAERELDGLAVASSVQYWWLGYFLNMVVWGSFWGWCFVWTLCIDVVSRTLICWNGM